MVLELKALESNFNDDYLQNIGKHTQPLYVSLHLPFKKRGGGRYDVNPTLTVLSR